MINHYIPLSLMNALDIMAAHDCYVMAGGTDLMLQKHRSSGLLPTFDKDVIYVSNISELNYITKETRGVHIGACVKYSDVLKSNVIPNILKDAVSEIASPNIRNMATLIGNIGNASPAGDTLPVLYILNAIVVLGSKAGKREVPIKDFIVGVRKTIRRSDELIIEIIIPPFDGQCSWTKVGSRAAETISKVSFAGLYKISNGIISDLRIAFGSVGVTVKRSEDIEKKYIGMTKPQIIKQLKNILKDYGELIDPIDDHRSTKKYRAQVAMNMLGKFIRGIK